MNKLLTISLLSTMTAVSMSANAFKFDTPNDWDIRWDNTVKGNLMYRVQGQDPSVYNPLRSDPLLAAQLADDADYTVNNNNWVSQRFDILSEMDVVWRDTLGLRVSGAGWYDFAYGGKSDAPQSGPTKGFPEANSTWGSLTVQPGEYTKKAKELHYRGGELLDAFVFANFDMGDTAANVRVGRHTLYWGQSFLSTGAIQGFAGSMAALDLAKGLGTPGSEAKELFIPNGKVSTLVQFTDEITVSAFYAFEFEPLRWPEGGTYFSLNEALTENSEFLTAAAGGVASPAAPRLGFKATDYKSRDSGDWGVNLQYYVDAWNLETQFIYMNNTDRLTSGLYGTLGATLTSADRALAAETNAVLLGKYGWVYKEGIKTMGMSLSKEMFGISWGADFVYRKDNALNPGLSESLSAPGVLYASKDDVNPGKRYPGATGDTAHIVMNGLGFLDGEWGLWDGGRYLVEVTLSTLLKYDNFEEKANAFIREDKLCSHVAGIFQPTWFQVRPGWDLNMLSSISYATSCRQAPVSAGGTQDVGNGSLGFAVDIEQTWNVALAYNIFFGPQANGTAAFIKDRNNVALTVKRTF
jgi:hypothetical protein